MHAAPLRARARAGARSATVDIHCHVVTPEAAALAKAVDPTREARLAFSSPATREVNRKQAEAIRGKLTGVEERLKDTDRMGIDVQAISPAPVYYYWAEPLNRAAKDAMLGGNAAHLLKIRLPKAQPPRAGRTRRKR